MWKSLQQIPLKPQDPNRGNDDPDQDPPQISSHLGSDILRLGLSEKGGHAPCRWKAELFCTQLDARDQRSMGLENNTGLRTPIRDHLPLRTSTPLLFTSIRKRHGSCQTRCWNWRPKGPYPGCRKMAWALSAHCSLSPSQMGHGDQ